MRVLVRILFILFYSSTIFAEEIVIQGTVVNSKTSKSIPNVNIFLREKILGTSSNNNGYFKIKIPVKYESDFLFFEHIGFDTLALRISLVIDQKEFYLNPKPIQSSAIQIEAERSNIRILKDLPQPITVIDNKAFEIRGYIDAGDLLSTDQSIQIEEETSGKKVVTMRAGNADDILVLLNGIKMNSIYDNIFDLSLINLEDVERFEIIKGSHTALYGSDGFSGVINVVPKWYKNYYAKVQQRFGSYNTADWNLQFNYDLLSRINLAYTYKKGNSQRKYVNDPEAENALDNNMIHHSANMNINLSSKQNMTLIITVLMNLYPI